MGDRDEQTMSRLKLADYLKNLSEELRQGALAAQGRHWTVPDDLDVGMEVKEKKGRLVVKLRCSWSTLGDYDGAARQNQPRPGVHENGQEAAGPAFKALQQVVSQGGFPDDRTLGDFVEHFRAFAALADPDWATAMQEYLDHLANLEHAVANRQPEVLAHELRDLQAGMSSCHREFKSRSGSAK